MIEVGDRAILKRLRHLKINSPNNKWWLISRRRNEPARIARVWEKRLGGAHIVSVSSR
jgi:hypothetical protein